MWAKDQAERLAAAAGGLQQLPGATRDALDGSAQQPAIAPPHNITFSFENTLDANASGDVYVKAEVAGAPPGSRIVFVPDDGPTSDAVADNDEHGVILGDGVEAVSAEQADHARKRLELAAAAAAALQTAWTKLSWRDRLRFFNGWALLALSADICNVASASLNIQERLGSIPTHIGHGLVMGLGLVFLWVGALRFLEHDR